jgi:hypothetical protein
MEEIVSARSLNVRRHSSSQDVAAVITPEVVGKKLAGEVFALFEVISLRHRRLRRRN